MNFLHTLFHCFSIINNYHSNTDLEFCFFARLIISFEFFSSFCLAQNLKKNVYFYLEMGVANISVHCSTALHISLVAQNS